MVLTEEGTDEEAQEEDNTGVYTITKDYLAKLRVQCEEEHQGEVISTDGLYCPWIFDGWSCVNTTPAGEMAIIPCPHFVLGFDKDRNAHKECTSNGTWFRHPRTHDLWSNYTNCVDSSGIEILSTVNKIYTIGYSLSMIALSVSLLTFFYFKSLKCTRVAIHKNLFTAFLMNNFLWFLWHVFVVNNETIHNNNSVFCQILHVLCHYFMVASYIWMFCEGLYLHILLVVTFLSEHKVIPSFFAFGWGSSLVLVIIYAACRGSYPKSTVMCWMEESKFMMILTIPVVISMVLNLVFLINIVRVLVTKLRAVNAGPNAQSTKKAVRATLILIPLLGLHFIITPFTPPRGSKFYNFYVISSAVAASFQGFAVSLLFCFLNGEVLSAFKKKWNQQSLMRRRGFSVPPSSYSVIIYNTTNTNVNSVQ